MSGTAPSVLVRPQRARGAIEHGIHEFEAIGGSKTLGERHCFVDRHAVRHFRSGGELIESDQERRTLDRIEQVWCAVGKSGEPGIELLALAPYSFHQRAEVIRIRARHVLRIAEFLYQVLPWSGVQLPAIERLQCELARDAALSAVLPCARCRHRAAHRRAITAAISSALSMASAPLLPAVV